MKILILPVLVASFISFTSPQRQACIDYSGHRNCHLLADDSTCGRRESRSSLAPRVFQGQRSGPRDHPWMASMILLINDYQFFSCGGSIINERYILTAAHCDLSAFPGYRGLIIRLGHDNKDENDCIGEQCPFPLQQIYAEDFVKHSNFLLKQLDNDIALIRLAQPIQYNEFVRPICLPVGERFNESFDGALVGTAGWGSTNCNDTIGEEAKELQELWREMVPQQECEHKFQLDKYKICTTNSNGRVRPGDSGGAVITPLITSDSEESFYILGVISGGYNCSDQFSGLPDMSTRVSQYTEWILDNMKPF